jgi:hypothetical protein
MTRKFKALGFAFVAVAAVSVAAAASVQAFEMHVTHQGSAVITAEQSEQFVVTTSAGSVKCSTFTLEGEVSGAGSQITSQHSTLTPTYSGCQAFGLAATVQLNGCKYTITNKLVQHTTARTAYIDIAGCTAGLPIQVNAGFGSCILTAPQQQNISHIVFENNSSPIEDVNANVTLTGFIYQYHGPLCPGAATEQRADGTITGRATVRTFKGTQLEQLPQHGHQFQRLKHSSVQVGVIAT